MSASNCTSPVSVLPARISHPAPLADRQEFNAVIVVADKKATILQAGRRLVQLPAQLFSHVLRRPP